MAGSQQGFTDPFFRIPGFCLERDRGFRVVKLGALGAPVPQVSSCVDGSLSRKATRSSFWVLLIGRYQLELKDNYITRTNRLIEDERKNKGDSGAKLYFSALM